MAGRGVVISITDCYRRTDYGEPILALKSYILSPFVDEDDVKSVVSKVLEAATVLNRDNFGTVTLFRAYPIGVDTFSIKRQEFEDEADRDSLLSRRYLSLALATLLADAKAICLPSGDHDGDASFDYNREIYNYVHSEAMAGKTMGLSFR